MGSYISKSVIKKSEPDPFLIDCLPPLLQDAILKEIKRDVVLIRLSCCSSYWRDQCHKIPTTLRISRIHLYQNRDWLFRNNRTKEFIQRRNQQVQSTRRGKSSKLHQASDRGFKVAAVSVKIKYPLTSKVCPRAIKLFSENETTARMFNIWKREFVVDCEPHEFGLLLKVLKCDMISCFTNIGSEYLTLPEFQKLSFVKLGCETDVTDQELLGFEADNVSISGEALSDNTIIHYIENCLSGARKWQRFYFSFHRIPQRAIDIGNRLGVVPYWTPERHQKSVFADFVFEDFQAENLFWTYCLSLPNGDNLYLKIKQNAFGVLICDITIKEEDILALAAITPEQQYLARKICPTCKKTPFCEHFRRFSAARFRRNCPRIFKTISFFSSIAYYVATFLGIVNNIPNIEIYVDSIFEHRTIFCRILRCEHLTAILTLFC